jgi:hypothetical protein
MVKTVEKRFGEIAIDMGFVNEGQLEEAAKVQMDQDADGLEHRLIGSILYSLGYMTIQQVNEVIEFSKQSQE